MPEPVAAVVGVSAVARAHGWRALALVVYAGVVVVLLLTNIDNIGSNGLALFCVAFVCGFPFCRTIRGVRFDPIEPIWVYTAIFFLEHFLKPILTLGDPASYGCNFFSVDYDTSATSRSLLFSALGFSFFYWGYISVLAKKAAESVPALADRWLSSRAFSAMLTAAVGFIVTIYFFAAKANFLIREAYLDRAQLNAGAGELVFFVHLMGLVVSVIVLRKTLENGWSGTSPFALATCIGIIGAYVIFGSRASLFFIPVTIVVLWHYQRKRFGARMLAVFFAGFFVLFALFAQYRAHYRWSVGSVDELQDAVRLEISNYNNWDIFLGIIQYYPNVKDHYYGRLATTSLMWLIPRRIWPSKPILYGPAMVQEDVAPGLRLIVDTGGFTGTTISQSTMGEAYADLGVLGIGLYMFIFGAVWGGLYNYLLHCSFSYPASALYAALYVGLPGYTRNFAPSLMNCLIWFLALFALFFWMGGGHVGKIYHSDSQAI